MMYKISYKSFIETKTDWLNFSARFCFQLSLLIGLISILGWIFEIRKIISIDDNFIPIAPDTAIIMFILSSILFYKTFNWKNKTITFFNTVLVYLIILYVSLKIIEFFIPVDLTFTNVLFPANEHKGQFLVKRISPVTSFLYFLSGIASIFYLSENKLKKYYNIIGLIGSTVFITGFIITTGYSFGTPLFYSGKVIPVALPAAIGITLIGIGISAAAGPDSFVNKLFTGTSVKALILRVFIPIIIIAVLLVGFIHQVLVYTNLNEGLAASLTTFLFIALTIIVSIKIAVKISNVIDKAETERSHAEERLRENLIEKETLLKELNHRVKNNFNLINSIIELSFINKSSKEEILASINTIKQRILTISLIHNQLYDSKSYSSIDFRPYIIKLADSLLAVNNNNRGIMIHYDIDKINLPITKAVPCGLIINEVLTNSFKYAFNGKKNGNIFISLKDSGGSIKLSINDDGKGLPEKLSLDNSETMGYTIVKELSSQLDGNSEIGSEDGAFFKLIFPSN